MEDIDLFGTRVLNIETYYGVCILNIDILQNSIMNKFKHPTPIILDNRLLDMDKEFTLTTIAIETQMIYQVNGLVPDCSNPIASALELLQSCTKPSKCAFNHDGSDSPSEGILESVPCHPVHLHWAYQWKLENAHVW